MVRTRPDAVELPRAGEASICAGVAAEFLLTNRLQPVVHCSITALTVSRNEGFLRDSNTGQMFDDPFARLPPYHCATEVGG
jgi:hypothetical protein